MTQSFLKTTGVMNEANSKKIIQGDIFKVMLDIPNDSVDMIFIDPPYNLKKNYSIHKVELYDDDAGNRIWNDINISFSMDNLTYTRFFKQVDIVFAGGGSGVDWDNYTYGECLIYDSNCGWAGDSGNIFGLNQPLYFNARYIKIEVNTSNTNNLQYREIKIHALNNSFIDYSSYQSFSSGVDTNSYTIDNISSFFQTKWKLNSDGVTSPIIYNFNATAYNQEAGGEDTTAPTVTLISPIDSYYNDTLSNTYFNCTATDTSGIMNISLWLTNNTNGSFSFNMTKYLL